MLQKRSGMKQQVGFTGKNRPGPQPLRRPWLTLSEVGGPRWSQAPRLRGCPNDSSLRTFAADGKRGQAPSPFASDFALRATSERPLKAAEPVPFFLPLRQQFQTERGGNRSGSGQNWGNQGGDFGRWGPDRFPPVSNRLMTTKTEAAGMLERSVEERQQTGANSIPDARPLSYQAYPSAHSRRRKKGTGTFALRSAQGCGASPLFPAGDVEESGEMICGDG